MATENTAADLNETVAILETHVYETEMFRCACGDGMLEPHHPWHVALLIHGSSQ